MGYIVRSRQNDFVDARVLIEGLSRHHNVVIVTGLALLPLVAAVGLMNGFQPTTLAANVLAAAMFLVIGASERVNVNLRPLLAISGLLTASATLVVNSQGEPASHLVFVFTLTLSTLYRSSVPYVLAVFYLCSYYAIAFFFPDIVYGTSSHGINTGWWSLALVSAAIITSIVTFLSWRIDASGARDREALQIALAEAALRQRQAIEIHDTVIQGLAVARYALDANDEQLALESIDKTLASAKELIGGLLYIEGASLSQSLLRDQPADPLRRGGDNE